MPPSGYTLEQSESVNGFLRSCAHSLEKEGIERQLSPTEALRAECDNITTALHAENGDQFAHGVLALTYSFYSELMKLDPKTYREFHTLVGKTLEKVKDAILNVHVAEM